MTTIATLNAEAQKLIQSSKTAATETERRNLLVVARSYYLAAGMTGMVKHIERKIG